MKTMTALILSLMTLIATAQAAEQYCAPACKIFEGKVNYECIASNLEPQIGDALGDVSVEDINKLLYTCKYTYHDIAIQVATQCEAAR